MEELHTIEEWEQIILNENDRIAHSVAHKHSGKGEYDDLVQVARLGMLHGLRTFDPQRKVKLGTHLYNRAWYALKHYLRKDTGIIHIPIYGDHGLRAGKFPQRTDWPEDFDPPAPDEYGALETRMILMDAMSKLRPREREAVLYHYIDGLTMVEAGKCMKVSHQRVLQLCQKGVSKLKKQLKLEGVTSALLLDFTTGANAC